MLRRHQNNDQLMFIREFITLFLSKNGGLGFWDPCLPSSRQNAIFVTRTGSLIYAGSTRRYLKALLAFLHEIAPNSIEI